MTTNSSILNWHVISNDGINLTAKNIVTNEFFEGLTSAFNTKVSESDVADPSISNVRILNDNGVAFNSFMPFELPAHDRMDILYANASEDITGINYYHNNTPVATLSFEYENDKLSRISKIFG